VRRLFANKAEVLLATRSVSPLVIVAMVAAFTSWTLLVWAWIYPSGLPARVAQETHGVISPTLVACSFEVVLAFAIACGLGQLRLRDLGLSRRGFVVGALATLGAWVFAQLVIVIGALIASAPLAHPPFELGEMLAQILGNSLDEEVVMRGFLSVQLVLLARRFTGPRTAWIVGFGIASIMFALSHIPQRLVSDHEHGGALAEDLVVLAWRGLALALVYLRTGHLEVAVGFHALWDVPLPVIASPIAGEAIIGAQVVLFVVWPYGANTSGVRNVRPAPA